MRKYNQYKSQNPKLETMHEKEPYAFTLNCKERFPTFKLDIKHNMYILKKYLVKHFSMVQLYPEISPTGRFHLHGIVEFNDYQSIVMWYRRDYSDNFNVLIKPINDTKEWCQYITKQKRLHSLLEENTKYTIPYTLSTIQSVEPPSIIEQFKSST